LPQRTLPAAPVAAAHAICGYLIAVLGRERVCDDGDVDDVLWHAVEPAFNDLRVAGIGSGW
jgi:hypothetical protein